MLRPDTLAVDYRDYTPPENLPKGRLIESGGIQMHVVGRGERTVVVPRAFHAYSGNPLEQLRDRVLADALDSRIVGIDVPGVGLNHTVQNNPLYKDEALQGSQASRSEAMLKAIVDGIELPENRELHFWGYSLGAWASAAILRSPTFREYQLKVGSVTLLDPVNDQDWQMRTVHKVLLREFGREKRYKRETGYHFPTLPAAISPEDPSVKMRAQPRIPSHESLALGKGMQFGFADSLAEAINEDSYDNATGLSQAPFTIYRANGSFASRAESLEQTMNMFHASGQKSARMVEFAPRADTDPHSHLFWHSVGAVGILAAHIRSTTFS